jgi:hypothetical protein
LISNDRAVAAIGHKASRVGRETGEETLQDQNRRGVV